MKLRFLSLFSGIEAASCAWGPLGWECASVAEIEPFPCAVLKHRYPGILNLGDVTKITEEQIKSLGHIDLTVFGSPCQDLSVAGKQEGMKDGTRSNLFFDAVRIHQWVRKHCGGRFALWENVPGAFGSCQGQDFAAVVGALAGLDDIDVPKNGWGTQGAAVGNVGMLEWAVLDSQWFGVPQRRRRIFALLDSGDWSNRSPILLEPESLRGHSPARGEAREVAPTIPSRSLGGGGLGTDFDCDGGLIVAYGGNNTTGPIEVATARSAHGGPHGRLDFESETFVLQSISEYSSSCGASLRATGGNHGGGSEVLCVTGGITHALTADGFDASEDGTGRGYPIISVAYRTSPNCGAWRTGNRIDALTTSTDPSSHLIGFSCKDHGADASDELSPTLRAMNHNGSHANSGGQIAIAFQASQSGMRLTGEIHPTLDSNNGSRRHHGAIINFAVRRLTPTECEKLQGFPVGWTDIPYRNHRAADGPRYKALGNSMTVDVMRWIGASLERSLANSIKLDKISPSSTTLERSCTMTKRLDLSYSFPLPESAFDQGEILAKIKSSVDTLTANITEACGSAPDIKTSIVTPTTKKPKAKLKEVSPKAA